MQPFSLSRPFECYRYSSSHCDEYLWYVEVPHDLIKFCLNRSQSTRKLNTTKETQYVTPVFCGPSCGVLRWRGCGGRRGVIANRGGGWRGSGGIGSCACFLSFRSFSVLPHYLSESSSATRLVHIYECIRYIKYSTFAAPPPSSAFSCPAMPPLAAAGAAAAAPPTLDDEGIAGLEVSFVSTFFSLAPPCEVKWCLSNAVNSHTWIWLSNPPLPAPPPPKGLGRAAAWHIKIFYL